MMNKRVIINLCVLFVLNLTFLFAEEKYLNIDANYFEANQQKNILHFKGDVKMTKNKDLLLCQDLLINTENSPTDPSKQIPKNYKATGDVSFHIVTEDNILKGKGDEVYYYPNEKKYIILGNGYLENVNEGKKIIAEKIYIDELTGNTKIDGGKDKPIKFRLRFDDNEDTNTNVNKEKEVE
ncbi:MAG: LptA/OstA family protein [Arcobacteraceae bacterium]